MVERCGRKGAQNSPTRSLFSAAPFAGTYFYAAFWPTDVIVVNYLRVC